jgi:hypothetical protein
MKHLLVLCLAFVAPAALAQTPVQAPGKAPSETSPLDGDWRGKSDGGSCKTPLDFALTIEAGIVDGTATDPAAHGPVPNLKRTAPPPPAPGLYQVYGTATSANFTLRALAAVQGQKRLETRFTGSMQGATMVLKESGGCGRAVSLARAR